MVIFKWPINKKIYADEEEKMKLFSRTYGSALPM